MGLQEQSEPDALQTFYKTLAAWYGTHAAKRARPRSQQFKRKAVTFARQYDITLPYNWAQEFRSRYGELFKTCLRFRTTRQRKLRRRRSRIPSETSESDPMETDNEDEAATKDRRRKAKASAAKRVTRNQSRTEAECIIIDSEDNEHGSKGGDSMSDSATPLSCKRCDRRFMYPKAFQKHMETHNVQGADKSFRPIRPVQNAPPQGRTSVVVPLARLPPSKPSSEQNKTLRPLVPLGSPVKPKEFSLYSSPYEKIMLEEKIRLRAKELLPERLASIRKPTRGRNRVSKPQTAEDYAPRSPSLHAQDAQSSAESSSDETSSRSSRSTVRRRKNPLCSLPLRTHTRSLVLKPQPDDLAVARPSAPPPAPTLAPPVLPVPAAQMTLPIPVSISQQAPQLLPKTLPLQVSALPPGCVIVTAPIQGFPGSLNLTRPPMVVMPPIPIGTTLPTAVSQIATQTVSTAAVASITNVISKVDDNSWATEGAPITGLRAGEEGRNFTDSDPIAIDDIIKSTSSSSLLNAKC